MSNDITVIIRTFLEKKKAAWSESTLASCKAFLNNYGLIVESGDPEALISALSSKGKYTVQTYFIHAANFFEYLYPHRENVFKAYRKENRNAFKNAYQTKHLEVTYDEVKAVLEAQPASEEKDACLYLLGTAQRSSEAGLLRNQSRRAESADRLELRDTIIGKGGKERPNFGYEIANGDHRSQSYYRVYHYLRRIAGISPHALRKLALTRAGERGASGADLCEIAGWSSITTAIRYLQPRRARELKKFLA
jgi:integrase